MAKGADRCGKAIDNFLGGVAEQIDVQVDLGEMADIAKAVAIADLAHRCSQIMKLNREDAKEKKKDGKTDDLESRPLSERMGNPLNGKEV